MNLIRGVITENYLNIRVTGPHTYDEPLPEVLSEGDEIMIKRALYGEELEGENVWYELEDGNFVWSGMVRLSVLKESILPSPKKVIFTADDYGVVDTINKGVIRAVKEGLLRSVTCFTNYIDPTTGKNISLEHIKTLNALKSDYPDLELGVHLTVTSGSPILSKSEVGLLYRYDKDIDKDYKYCGFPEYTKLRKHYRKRSREKSQSQFLSEMKKELKAQLDVFKNAGIDIDHITSHHNSLLYEAEFFEIMCDLAKEYKTKIGSTEKPTSLRSLENIPGWKDYGFLLFKGKILFPNKTINELKKIKNTDFKDVKSPEILHSDYYGPIPMAEKKGKSYANLVQKKIGKGEDMLNDLRGGAFDNMEFLLHLRDGDIEWNQKNYKNETKATGYAGINPKAFDARNAEFDSFIKKFKNLDALEPSVSMGSWKEVRY